SQGAELELNGELKPGWLIGAGYTYDVYRISGGESFPMLSPRHLLKLWTSLQLPGELSRWTVGASLAGESHTDAGAGFNCSYQCDVNVPQKSYAVLDMRTAYRIDSNWQVALNVNNVLDKTYYDSIDPYNVRAFYGQPRNVMLRVDARF